MRPEVRVSLVACRETNATCASGLQGARLAAALVCPRCSMHAARVERQGSRTALNAVSQPVAPWGEALAFLSRLVSLCLPGPMQTQTAPRHNSCLRVAESLASLAPCASLRRSGDSCACRGSSASGCAHLGLPGPQVLAPWGGVNGVSGLTGLPCASLVLHASFWASLRLLVHPWAFLAHHLYLLSVCAGVVALANDVRSNRYEIWVERKRGWVRAYCLARTRTSLAHPKP